MLTTKVIPQKSNIWRWKTHSLGTEFTFKEMFWWSILVLFWVNFLGVGIYAPFILIPATVIYLTRNKINSTHIILVFFSAAYAVSLYMYGFATKANMLIHLLYPITFYTVGFALVKGDIEYKKTYRFLALLIVTFTAFGAFAVFKTVSAFGDMLVANTALGGRVVLGVWSDKVIGATGLNTYLSFGLSLLSVVFLRDKNKQNKVLNLICLTCFSVAVYCTMIVGNRTGIGIALLSVVSVFFFVGKMNLKKVAQLITMIAVFFALRYLFLQNLLGVQTAWEQSILSARFEQADLTDDPRYGAWSAAFNGLFDNPMGGKETELPCCVAYAHNLWLDVGHETGVFPFLILVLFTIISLSAFWLFLKNDHPILLKGIVVGLFTAFFITFFVEPIMVGWFSYFHTFCFLLGIVQSLNLQSWSRKQHVSNT